MRAIAIAGEASRRRGSGERARPAGDGRARALAAKVSTREPYVFSDAGRARIAVVDYGCKRSILNRLAWSGARGHGLPARRGRRRARPLRRRAALERPRRSRAARGTRSQQSVLGRTCPDSRDLPRAPAACARDRARDVQASVRTPRREPSGRRARHRPGARHLARTTGSPSRRARRREATHVSLYDGTVEGLEYPGAARALRPVPPRGRPRPARRLGPDRRLGRGGERACQGGVTSSRSA